MQFQACAYCDHPNPVGTNYCNDCGAALHLKPCRLCGAVAVAQARHCPACKAEFPARPTINVDIPWAVPNPVRGSGAPDLRAPLSPLVGEADAVFDSASDQALKTTKRLIEKASTRPVVRNSATELELPPPTEAPPRRDRPAHSSVLPARPPLPAAAVAEAMHAAPPEDLAATPYTRAIAELYGDTGSTRRLGRVILVSLSSLLAAAVVIYLVGYADEDTADPTQEIASPHRFLAPAGSPAPAPAADQVGETVDEAPPVANVKALPKPAPGSNSPAFQAPVSTPLAPSPTASGECGPELRALNLCGR